MVALTAIKIFLLLLLLEGFGNSLPNVSIDRVSFLQASAWSRTQCSPSSSWSSSRNTLAFASSPEDAGEEKQPCNDLLEVIGSIVKYCELKIAGKEKLAFDVD